MKTTNVAILALACAGLSPLHGEQTGEVEGIKSRPSHAALAKRMSSGKDPLAETTGAKMLAAESIQKKKKKHLGSLVARSSILAYGGFWTLIPKGSILHMPPTYEDRLSAKPSGKLLSWQEFYSRNRGWISPQAVELENARGEVPLSEEVLKNHQRQGRVVVAVLHHGPISVKPPKPSPAPAGVTGAAGPTAGAATPPTNQ